jgi:hypothetical protein
MYSTSIYPGQRDVFATNMMEANRLVIGALMDRLKSRRDMSCCGCSRRDSFRVIIRDDSAENYHVKAVHGP